MIFNSFKNKFQLRFKNREITASILEGTLEDSLKKIKIVNKKEDENLLLIGIPRGGVVVADIVASKLKSSSYSYIEFDIIISRKIAAPGNQEIALLPLTWANIIKCLGCGGISKMPLRNSLFGNGIISSDIQN
jgi:putative phosphoribosyl transferase